MTALEEIKKALEEAALSAAEPVACEYGHDNGDGTYSATYSRWPLPTHVKPHVDWPIKLFYAAPPAPSVAVKALASEIKKLEVSYHVGECMGLADWAAFEAGITKGLEAAAEKVSALSAQVQDVAESKTLNLNVTKEWFEKRSALEGDHEIGAGRRKLTAIIDPTPEELAELHRLAHRVPEGWQLVPKEPTEAMLKAGDANETYVADHEQSVERIWRAMLAAAPAKQEG